MGTRFSLVLEVGLQGRRWSPCHSHHLLLLLPCIFSAMLGGCQWPSLLCTSLCPCRQSTAKSPLEGDRNQPCLVLVQNWEIPEALILALRSLGPPGFSLLPAGLRPAFPKRWWRLARSDPAQRFHCRGGSEQPMKSGSGLGTQRRGLQRANQSSCNHQRLSIFSCFSYENQTENPKGKVSFSHL